MHDELLEKEIIPAIERENDEELSVKEIESITEKLDDTNSYVCTGKNFFFFSFRY